MSEERYGLLTRFVNRGGNPPRDLLKRSFPNAFRRLREVAGEVSLPVWDLATVAYVWRHRHGHEGDCRVLRVRVARISEDENIVFVVADGETTEFPVIDRYHLSPAIGASGYVHRRVFVEIADAHA
jgi:hypothetical protein